MHDTAKGCCRSEESVSAWGDAWYVGLASCEKLCMRKGFVESLNQDTNHSAKGGPNCHRRYEYAGGYLATIGNDDKKGSHDRSKQQR